MNQLDSTLELSLSLNKVITLQKEVTMNTLRIHCPHCGGNSQLYLASRPLILVVNCPDCQATLLHSEDETFKVDSSKIVHMNSLQIREYIHNLKDLSQSVKTSTISPPRLRSFNKSVPRASHSAGEALREAHITPDDLINLKIDLESCMDISDFIKKLDS